jgi:hypothetical protein
MSRRARPLDRSVSADGSQSAHAVERMLETGSPSRTSSSSVATLALIAVGVAMELVLLAGWLRPLSLWRHQVNPPDGAPMVTILGRTRDGALQFAVPAVLLVVLYALAVRVSLVARGRLAVVVALVAPAVFAATLVPMFPGGTQDIFHNIADGRLLWRYGENPTLVPPIAYPNDGFYPHLFGYVDLPSAYGPLWYALAGIPTTLAGDGLVANLIAQKAMMSVFLIATVALVAWSTRLVQSRTGDGGRVEPATAAVIAGWCPLLLWEAAGNGHNDVFMVFFAAAALVALLRGWWLWVLPLLALSALVKFTTVLLGPVILLWMLRRPEVPRRHIAGGIGIAIVTVAVAYVPFWAGADTFAFLRRPGMTFILSPATLLHGALAGPMGDQAASRWTQLLTGGVFAGLYTLAMWRARGGAVDLLRSGFDALFAYLVFASWWFWPWYLSWLAPLAALLPARDGRRPVFVAITGAALLTYCYWWSDPLEGSRQWFIWYGLMSVAVFGVPLMVWLRFQRRQGSDRRSLPPSPHSVRSQ